ncbi:GNAT family N-acetyltransferase [Bacillus sp. LL01]|uniref:GNAT family N-acetyltransferase n=1 Tax=Bacillus sp. LL01 TaxID=1665556 RepID=UPI00069FE46C|nr:GNAT family N-acetyltransferase [Bacillus sp. LL01]
MEIRLAAPGDESAIAHVHVESWRTTYRGIIEDSYLQDISKDRRQQMWKGAIEQGYEKSCLFVAVDEGEIVGFANAGPERTNGYGIDTELFAIYLLKDYQKKGIGRKLVEQVARFLQEKNYQSMLVWVLTDNPGRQFYLSLLPEKVETKLIGIGGEHYEEIAFAWRDLKELLSKLDK